MSLRHTIRERVRSLVGTYFLAGKLDEVRALLGANTTATLAASSQFRAEQQTHDDRTASYAGQGLRVSFRPQATYPHTVLRIEAVGERVFEEDLAYSHHGLALLLTGHAFDTVLEIGSAGGTAARAFAFVGKTVSTCEILAAFESDFSGDYLDLRLADGPVDAIWCSHVLEHQRHLGRFLEKMHDDLREGGVLAVTVPAALSPLLIGHCNIFTPLHLIYQLILAGFDCADASILTYDWQYSIVVRKRSNFIPRISFASTPFEFDTTAPGHVAGLLGFFPREVQNSFHNGNAAWGELESIHWGVPR